MPQETRWVMEGIVIGINNTPTHPRTTLAGTIAILAQFALCQENATIQTQAIPVKSRDVGRLNPLLSGMPQGDQISERLVYSELLRDLGARRAYPHHHPFDRRPPICPDPSDGNGSGA
jgi:hypothetical protein